MENSKEIVIHRLVDRRLCDMRSAAICDECEFSHMSALKSIAFPDSVTTIGEYVCFNDNQLKEMTLPNNLEEISTINNAYRIFEYTGLTTITLPANLIKMGPLSRYITDVKDVYYSGTIEELKNITVYMDDGRTFDAVYYLNNILPNATLHCSNGNIYPINPSN